MKHLFVILEKLTISLKEKINKHHDYKLRKLYHANAVKMARIYIVYPTKGGKREIEGGGGGRERVVF